MVVFIIPQDEVAEPMEDEMFVSYPIVIPTGSEEPLSCSPTGQSHLSNQMDSMNFERCEHNADCCILKLLRHGLCILKNLA